MATIDERIIPIEAVHPTELIIDEIKERGISRKDMAIRLGMQPSNFSRMLKQKETITPQMANKLEEALGIKVELNIAGDSKLFIAERNDFEQKLRSIPFLHVMPSQANYFLCEVLPPFHARSIVIKLLRKYNILTRDCSDKSGFDGKQYMRLAVRNHADNTRLVEALKGLGKEGMI